MLPGMPAHLLSSHLLLAGLFAWRPDAAETCWTMPACNMRDKVLHSSAHSAGLWYSLAAAPVSSFALLEAVARGSTRADTSVVESCRCRWQLGSVGSSSSGPMLMTVLQRQCVCIILAADAAHPHKQYSCGPQLSVANLRLGKDKHLAAAAVSLEHADADGSQAAGSRIKLWEERLAPEAFAAVDEVIDKVHQQPAS